MANIIKKILKATLLLAVTGGIIYSGVTVITALMEKGSINSAKTISEITGIDLDKIDHIETQKTNGDNFDPSEFRRIFGANLYEPFSDNPSTKKSETYSCYDAGDNLIMTLTEYAHESVIELNVSGEISLYKKYTPPTEAPTPTSILTK